MSIGIGSAEAKTVYKDPIENFQQGWEVTGCSTTLHYDCVNDSIRNPDTPDTSDYLVDSGNNKYIDEHGVGTLKPNSFNWIALEVFADTSARSAQVSAELLNGTNAVASRSSRTGTGVIDTGSATWTTLNWTTPTNPADMRGWFRSEKGPGQPQTVTVDAWYIEVGYNDLKPRWRNQVQNVSLPTSGEYVELSAEGFDDLKLSNATLATNESGTWENKTGIYDSPITNIGTSDTYTETNFTWRNSSIRNKVVGWRIYYKDSGIYYSDSRTNSTDIKTFEVKSPEITEPKFNFDPIEAGLSLNVTVNVTAPSRQSVDQVRVNLTDADGNKEYLNKKMVNDSSIPQQFYFNTTLKNESSNIGDWKVNATVNNTFGVETTNSSILTVLEKTPPKWRNQAQSKLDVDTGNTNVLEAEGFDNFVLDSAILSTNETGTFENKTANYGSPQSIGTSQTYSLTQFSWSNISVNNTEVAWKIYYNDTLGQYNVTDTKKFFVNGQDMNVTNVAIFEDSLVEGKEVNITVNISNIGTGKVFDGEVNLTIESYNGTWNEIFNSQKITNISESGFQTINFSWTPGIGPYRITAEADPDNKINEIYESNNVKTAIKDVPSHQIFYGGNEKVLELGASSDNFNTWITQSPTGNIYFADTDASFDFIDLEPVDTGDLSIVDDELNLTYHNDSISDYWNSTKDYDVGGSTLTNVPVADSSSGGEFKTGILFDTADGSTYDGSQDLIFITEISPNTDVNNIGNVDYVSRVPSNLQKQVPSTPALDIYTELG